jgi:uncharacterized protein with LGFP repeats
VIGIKQGWMCCFSDGYIWRHSAGIVGKDSRYIVVVLARDTASKGSAHTVASSTSAVKKMFPSGLIPRVQGAIGERWYATGGHSGRLGLPTSQHHTVTGGARQSFAKGSLYWSSAGGARVIEPAGAIRVAWIARDKERGRLGFPISDQACDRADDGCYQRFQGGSLYWSSDSGAHVISRTGAIRDAWVAAGKEDGPLGYPRGDEACVPGGCTQVFQGGTLTADPDGDVVRSAAAAAAAITTAPERSPSLTPTRAPEETPADTAEPTPPTTDAAEPSSTGAP